MWTAQEGCVQRALGALYAGYAIVCSGIYFKPIRQVAARYKLVDR